MTTAEQILAYIDSLPEPRQSDMAQLHNIILAMSPDARLWFLDGRDETGKVVSNPNVGYGALEKRYANGKAREFYQVGISANSSGISVYIMGIADRTYLRKTYGADIGRAELTGYCIKFKALAHIDLNTLQRVIQDGLQRTHV